MVAATRSKMGRLDDGRRWSEIVPAELLVLILQRLTIRDLIRCGAVCKSWRSVILEGQWSPEPPWLALRINGALYRFSERNKVQRMNKAYHPRLLSGLVLGSSNGWVGLQLRDKIRLFHPLKGTVLRLPSLITIPGVIAYKRGAMITGLAFPTGEMVPFVFHERYSVGMPSLEDIFLVPPSRTATAEFRGVVLAVCRPLMRLVFVVVGGGSAWSLVDMPAPLCEYVDNVASYRGSVYAVDVRGRVAAWDGNGEVPQFTRVIISSGPPEEPEPRMIKRYLVEANGELLQVLRYVDASGLRTAKVRIFRLQHDQLREGEEEQEQEGRGKDSITGTTVCEEEEEEKKKKNYYYYWAAMSSLGDLSLFLGINSPAAFSSQDFPWLERNCIYFTNRYHSPLEKVYASCPSIDENYYELGVYQLSTRTERAIRVRAGRNNVLAGLWFIPML